MAILACDRMRGRTRKGTTISDHLFKRRVLAAIEQPPKGKFLAIVNSSLFLWFLTLLVITAGGASLTSYQQCLKEAEEAIERDTKVRREIFQRELKIKQIILGSSSVADMRTQLKQPNAYYPEFAGFPSQLLRESTLAFLQKVTDFKKLLGDAMPPPRPEILGLYPIAGGQFPEALTDKDIPLLREFANSLLAAVRPIPLPGYGLSRFEPSCGPKTLWARSFAGPSVSNIRVGATPPPPPILPYPQ